MEDSYEDVSRPPHPIPGITAASEAPNTANKLCNTLVHRWTMRRNAAVHPRFVLLLEEASLPWEEILGGGGEQSLTYKDDHMVYWRRLRIWPTSVQHAT